MPNNGFQPDYPWEGIRPRIITVASVVFLFIGVFYLVKFIQVIIQWQTLASLPLTISPVYLLLDGLIRGFSAVFLSWSLWIGKSWARTAGMYISISLIAATWLDLILIAEPNTITTRWPFNLFLTLIGLPLFWLVLSHKSSKSFFRGNPVKIR
jgi:hypothetical protein